MFDFEKLTVYQKAKEARKILFTAIPDNKTTDKAIYDQLKRAVLGIILNIAEGTGKASKADKKNFFTIARGSTNVVIRVSRVMKKVLFLVLIALFLSVMVMAQEKYGQLNIISKRGEYIILIDKEKVGTTPLKLKRIPSGSHLLRVIDRKTYLTIMEKTILEENIFVKEGKINTIIIEEEIEKQPIRKEKTPEKEIEKQPKAVPAYKALKSIFEIESSKYAYEEPSVMRLTGTMYGITYSHTTHSNRNMWKYDYRYFWGTVNYVGSTWDGTPLTIDDISDWGYETRGIWGYDYPLSDPFYLTPYFGLGYRYLNDNMQLKYSGGYQRESNYYYIPLGIEISRSSDNNGFFEVIIEYDYFLSGKQISHLSNASYLLSDVTNQQHSGHGLRSSIGYFKKSVNVDYESKGFVRLWNIDESDIVSGVYEPKNNTTEIGFSIGVRF